MEITDYFNQIDISKFKLSNRDLQNKHTLLNIDKAYTRADFNNYQLAIIGVPEQRNSPNKGTAKAPDKIREQLYKLNYSGKAKIMDLGNLIPGKSVKDTYAAITDITFMLLSDNVIPVILGGSQDLTIAVFEAYSKLNMLVDLVCIDSKFDLGYKKNDFDSESFIGQIILNKGKTLYNLTNLGYQAYYTNKDEQKLFNRLSFDSYRLGFIRGNMEDLEPVMRDADMISIDIRAIKQSDAPAHYMPSPNGFYSEEICQLSRYAGLSDRVSSFGIFDLNPKYDINEITAGLAAQIIWYFIDGINSRQKDYPRPNSKEYTKHIVSFERTDQNIVFYQNNYNKRWWMEVPIKKLKKNKLIACTYNDYKIACNQEIPDRWLKTIQRLS
jgi:arginase family enzyme